MPSLETAPAAGCLLGNIVLFGRLLRHLGFEVTPAHTALIASSAEWGLLRARGDFRRACRAILVKRREQIALFDLAFALFWTRYADQAAEMADLGRLLRETRQRQAELILPAADADATQAADGHGEPETVMTYSPRAVSRQKDFARMTEAELEQVKQALQTFAWEILRKTRRTRSEPAGRRVDPRKSFRVNLRYGGEPLQRAMRSPRFQRRSLVTLCDISGSMERYSRILLQFVFALTHRMTQSEAFVFSTQLSRITRQLQLRTVEDALRQVGRTVQGWGGGTRIGEAVRQFNFQWARKVLGQGAVVLIISDGWDRGEIPLLAREMARLQRTAHRVVWLNPLLGSARYEPLTRGMQAALPHIDHFRPVHNLVSLHQLGELLARVQ